jgi:hypothetical protein
VIGIAGVIMFGCMGLFSPVLMEKGPL